MINQGPTAASTWPPIAVMGAGSVGCYFGAMLARAGAPVTLIGRPQHVEAIARDGLWLESRAFAEFVPLGASTDPAAARGAAVVLLAVKTLDTAAAAMALAPHLASGAVIVSLQNGVDNARQIRAHTGASVLPAVVYVAAEMTGPGRLKHNGRGDLVLGHPARGPRDAHVEPMAALFTRAAIPCRISNDIEANLWDKLAMNCAFNAISALARARYGRIGGHELVRGVVRLALDEAVAVANADGVALSAETLMLAADKLGAAVPEALSSTAQDIMRGKRTEIDDLNGYVVRRGQALGIATPVNQTLHGLVRLLEESGSRDV